MGRILISVVSEVSDPRLPLFFSLAHVGFARILMEVVIPGGMCARVGEKEGESAITDFTDHH
jgi:hypothetical protein